MASRAQSWFIRRRWSILSALLTLLAFPPFDLWPLAFVALVPLFHQVRSSDAKESFGIGYLYGLILTLGQLFWLDSLAARWTHSQLLALLPWVLASAYTALFFGWVANIIRHCYTRNWLILIPVVYAGVEVCRSYVPVLAFPWSLMGTPLYGIPALIQSAHYGTIYLISAWVVLVNVGFEAALDPASRRQIWKLASVGVAVLLAGFYYYLLQPPAAPFRLTIAQPGVDMAFVDAGSRSRLAQSIDGFIQPALDERSQLLVLPEGVSHGTEYPPKTDFRIDPHLPVLFGGQRGDGPTYQTAFSFDGRWHYADKTRLVIFGEFVPGRSTFPFIAKWFDLSDVDLSASKAGVQSVDVAGTRAGPMLCFEGLFPEISYSQARNGAQFVAVMCIDDWYMGTSAPEQLMAGSVFRAVETGLPLVRSASLGYSMLIDGHGRVLRSLPLGHRGEITTDVELPKESTVFPLLPLFPVASLLVALALPWLPKRISAFELDKLSKARL